MQINNVEGILNYQKLLFLRDLKEKFEPKAENVRVVVLNETKPRKKEEIAGELKFRFEKSTYSLSNIKKALEMLRFARDGLEKYDQYVKQAKEFIVKSKEYTDEQIANLYNQWKISIKYLVDSTRIKYLRLLTTEDFKKNIEFRRRVRARTDFRKRFDAKLNPALIYNKIIIHTAIQEEPFVQINIPVELGYKTYKLDEIELNTDEGKVEFIKRLTELETIAVNEKENSDNYIEKLESIKRKIEIYRHNIEATLSSQELSNVEAKLNKEDIKDQKLNFSVVTNKTQKGMVYNFIA
ncbi:hypothetical protein KA977_10405 [Candidatus Dependentiae bacterium]|nr:hypothetical protein [Candidatus Dependentiae bacterium]